MRHKIIAGSLCMALLSSAGCADTNAEKREDSLTDSSSSVSHIESTVSVPEVIEISSAADISADMAFDPYASKNRLTNFRTDRSTEDTLIELIATGRPAVLEVCYGSGNILSDFQGYSHWICINGYKKTDSGTQFRYSDTIAVSENWVDSDMLDKSNANVSYGDFYIQPERYICSFEEPLL